MNKFVIALIVLVLGAAIGGFLYVRSTDRA